ncbi:hypothetical protein V493_05390, partial [Pseudogymnoascus sp. VKM F-4281 (FW-2241)]
MRYSTALVGVSLHALHAAALPVASAESPFTSTSPALTSSTPAPVHDWSAGYVSDFVIHSSCNSTERHEIAAGLEQAVTIAQHAKEHILIHRNSSKVYQKYFGNGPTAPVIGWLDKIATANRAGVIFRCDDPDKNCATQDNWAGHHRGSNATAETVICEPSYTSRRPLTALCARGFDMATGRTNDYWAADLMHRLYHVPTVGEDEVGHYADGYAELLELATGANYTDAARNSASLSYFALEAYAYDISVPGEGCAGKLVEEDEHDHGAGASATTSAGGAAVTSVEPTRVIPGSTAAPEPTAPAGGNDGKECHTHDDGTEHCGRKLWIEDDRGGWDGEEGMDAGEARQDRPSLPTTSSTSAIQGREGVRYMSHPLPRIPFFLNTYRRFNLTPSQQTKAKATMETIHRAASAATEVIFGEHGNQQQHGQSTQATTDPTTSERTHEPLSGASGNTQKGEPY